MVGLTLKALSRQRTEAVAWAVGQTPQMRWVNCDASLRVATVQKDFKSAEKAPGGAGIHYLPVLDFHFDLQVPLDTGNRINNQFVPSVSSSFLNP